MFLIYGLRDPLTNEIRYVGQSSRGLERPCEHAKDARREQTHKARWINALRRMGLSYEVVVLERVADPESLNEAERKWIAIARSALGDRLTNLTDGGDGAPGCKTSLSSRQKMSRIARARWSDPQQRAVILASLKAALLSRPKTEPTPKPSAEETFEKRSAAAKRRWSDPKYRAFQLARLQSSEFRARAAEVLHLPETREKRRAALTGRKASPEVKAKIAAGQHRRYESPEERAKTSAASRLAHSRPETREKMHAHGMSQAVRFGEAGKAAMQREDIRVKHKAAMKAIWADPERRTKQAERVRAAHRRRLGESA